MSDFSFVFRFPAELGVFAVTSMFILFLHLPRKRILTAYAYKYLLTCFYELFCSREFVGELGTLDSFRVADGEGTARQLPINVVPRGQLYICHGFDDK